MARTYEQRCVARRANLRKMYLAVKAAKYVHGYVRYSKHDELCVKLSKAEVIRILRKKLARPAGTIADRLTKWSVVNDMFFFLG